MDIQEYFNGLINNQQLSEMLNQQHYTFAHKIMPYIVENNFQELVSKVIDKSAQNWILQLWNKCSGIQNYNYTSLIYPTCNFTRHSEDIGLIYIAMPALRVSPEAVYIAVTFLIDDDLPSDWLQSYFTLELGLAASAYWTLGEWDNSNHVNLGKFKIKPNLNNFIKTVIAESESRWC